MFALYQSHGPLLGVGETMDGALEDARNRHPGMLLVNDIGETLALEQYTDHTMVGMAPGLEVSGELYLRRCTLGLFEAVHAQAGEPTCPWTVYADGRVALVHTLERTHDGP